jgi:hypothetical protein
MKIILALLISVPPLAFSQGGGGVVVGNGGGGGLTDFSSSQYLSLIRECAVNFEDSENNYLLVRQKLKKAGANHDEITFLISYLKMYCPSL